MAATVHLEGIGEDDGGQVFYLQLGDAAFVAEMTLANKYEKSGLSLTQAIRKSLEPFTVPETCKRAIDTGIIEPKVADEASGRRYSVNEVIVQLDIAVRNPDGISEQQKWQPEWNDD